MARKSRSRWSENKSPEEVAAAVARWIADGGEGESPLTRPTVPDETDESGNDPELTPGLLDWLAEENPPVTADPDGEADDVAEEPDSGGIELAPEDEGLDPLAEDAGDADIDELPPPPREPPAPPLANGNGEKPLSQDEAVSALAAQVNNAWQGGREAAASGPQSAGAAPPAETPPPPDEAEATPVESAAPEPSEESAPPPIPEDAQAGQQQPDKEQESAGRTADTPPGEESGRREPVFPPPSWITKPVEEEGEKADEEVASDGTVKEDEKIVPIYIARPPTNVIPPGLSAVAASEETERRAADLHAERLAQPVPQEPPRTSDWSRRFTLFVALFLIVALAGLGVVTMQMMSEPPEPPIAAKPAPPEAEKETQKAEAQPSKPESGQPDPMAALFNDPPPAKPADPPATTRPPDAAPKAAPPAMPESPAATPGSIQPVEPVPAARDDGPPPIVLAPPPQSSAPAPVPAADEPAPAPEAAPPATVEATPPKKVEPAKPAAPSGRHSAQLGAVRDAAVAAREVKRLSSRLKDVLPPYKISVVEAAIRGRGTFYRLRVMGFDSLADVETMCRKIKEKRVPCVAVR